MGVAFSGSWSTRTKSRTRWEGHTNALARAAAREVVFALARRQLLSNWASSAKARLAYRIRYELAQRIAAEAGAQYAILECRCPDHHRWMMRVEAHAETRLEACSAGVVTVAQGARRRGIWWIDAEAYTRRPPTLLKSSGFGQVKGRDLTVNS